MRGTLYAVLENIFFVGGAVVLGMIIGSMGRSLRRSSPETAEVLETIVDQSEKVAELETLVASQEAEGLKWLASHKELESQVAAAKDEVIAASGKEALADAASEIADLNAKLGEIDTLASDLDTARGRSAELERKLADALANGPASEAGGSKLDAANQLAGVLTGKLGAANDRITALEIQIARLG